MFFRLKEKLMIIKAFLKSNSFTSLILERKISISQEFINQFITPKITSKIPQLRKVKIKLKKGKLYLYLFPSSYISNINICIKILQSKFTKKQKFINFKLLNQIQLQNNNSFNNLLFPVVEKITTKFIKDYLEELYIDNIKVTKLAFNLYQIDLTNITTPKIIRFTLAFLNVTEIEIKKQQLKIKITINKTLLCI